MKKSFGFVVFLLFWMFGGVVVFFGIFRVAHVVESRKVLVCISEGLCFLWVLVLGIGKVSNSKMKTGFFIPLVIVDATNLFVVTILNMFVCSFLSDSLFLWIQMIVVFIHLMITVPLFVEALKKEEV